MVVFVIPVPAKRACRDWLLVSTLFERTVRSICRQTCQEFRVIVICNERPPILFEHPNIVYAQVRFQSDHNNLYRDKIIDKFRRKWVGFSLAKQFAPCHVMAVDDDDCINQNIVAFVNKHPGSNGWFLDSSYVYNEGSRFIYIRNKGFCSLCDSSLIRRHDLIRFPPRVSASWFDYNALSIFHEIEYVHMIKERENIDFEVLPFKGAVYIIGHGQNLLMESFRRMHRGNLGKGVLRDGLLRIKEARHFRLLTNSIRKEYGLYNIDRKTDNK